MSETRYGQCAACAEDFRHYIDLKQTIPCATCRIRELEEENRQLLQQVSDVSYAQGQAEGKVMGLGMRYAALVAAAKEAVIDLRQAAAEYEHAKRTILPYQLHSVATRLENSLATLEVEP